MVCYHPIKGYRTPSGTVTFNRSAGFSDVETTVACGRCSGCRLERSRQWAVRCIHEAQCHDANSFLTLTFNDEHLPDDESVNVRDLQLFMKRLRKKYGKGIRYFACGEYGEENGRPHYHVCLFGHDFSDDRRLWKRNKQGDALYISDKLERLWSSAESGEVKGHCTVGELTWNTAAYTARYVMKKVQGNAAKDHYKHITRFGEVVNRRPEFVTMSRRPGIGRLWFERYRDDAYPDDFVVIRGMRYRVPKYYDQFEDELSAAEYDELPLAERKSWLIAPTRYNKLKSKRKRRSVMLRDDNTPERLRVKERIHESRMTQLKRQL